ncbi:MAG: HEAT repeat domain-containing protein [Myxococcaceae bacterium]
MRAIGAAALLCTVACANQNPKAAEEKRAMALNATPAELRPKVEALLNGYERIPTDEDWKRLGPNALQVLEQIYADPAVLPTRRTRAVASMAQVDNPAAAERLRSILKDTQADVQYRSTAAQALSARLGPDAVPDLNPSLSDKDARVREGGAKALSRVSGPEARQLLEDRLGNEEDPAVREIIQQSLTKSEP